MVKIIAHRGWWLKKEEQNTVCAFQRAINNGFGIETDFRDFNSEIVISHDIPTSGSSPIQSFFDVVGDSNLTMACNIKSDGLSAILANVFERKKANYFFFDMSIPDTLSYLKRGLPVYTRLSDIEREPIFYEEAIGVWLDNFKDNRLNIEQLDYCIRHNKSVCIVSPELHGFCYQSFWFTLKQYISCNPSSLGLISICTDYPMEAKDFFNGN
ncbi:hypothetical protein HR060_08625 [Catenovulum sp. SM1970]|uniref:hypothetical protein n=1 Tax=Marinifaba aquimaris TaxID=2741323 RepID=UPI001573713B|nr:hypothetical protein [Marinifaba aquimaris]NTS76934.1 hypothetical protein [Marinifaba aquimaris]